MGLGKSTNLRFSLRYLSEVHSLTITPDNFKQPSSSSATLIHMPDDILANAPSIVTGQGRHGNGK